MRVGLDEGRIRRGSVLRESQRAFRFEFVPFSVTFREDACTWKAIHPIIPLSLLVQSLTELRKSRPVRKSS